MSDDSKPLTNATEVSVYVGAHLVGIFSAFFINPFIFAALVTSGHRESLPLVGFGLALLTMVVVLFLFLLGRKAMDA